ncbi:DUF4232 domain-containing protein [Streptomyces caelestis]|jgi:hypothetical protein|uniref:DUF4232 domain-containing protein n=1 Tax=Streptomyces caelestis TaxID=36816 RepID=A0A7W9H6P2_9ACTN|nr:DUF4232 domain-containing protein [Streptomyces caelestis]MBB5796299.1 hypothetical protein [Streptomyces caelestis]GGW42205.1 hypothetical protein GCM10010320_22670 [Streptomyces caelestis]
MRIAQRSTTRVAASSLVAAAAFTLVGVQAAGQTASAATPQQAPVTASCTAANTELTVKDVPRPINTLLLTATNTGTKPCNLYGAPYLAAGAGAQAPVPWLDSSKPQAVVTLAPGESGYAGIGTSSPDGDEGYIAKTLGVHFANKQQNGSIGKGATLPLPNGGVYFNSANFVTYWQSDVYDALFG